jgi:hypothetical protein
MDAPIKVIKNFIQEPEIKMMIDYVDYLENTELDKFGQYQDGKRLTLHFAVGEEDPHCRGHTLSNLSLLGENRANVNSYFKVCLEAVSKAFKEKNKLYVCAFWLAKQYPGAVIGFHADTGKEEDPGNEHFKYSAITYLNTMTTGGKLIFKDFDYEYTPEAGDLVIFPSYGIVHGVKEIFETRYSIPMWITEVESMALS